MNSPVCVNCRNEKPVNRTGNRLVTEACGHVKCMDCLLQEKDGCVACINEKLAPDSSEVSDPEDRFTGDSVHTQTDTPPLMLVDTQVQQVEDLSKKKKLETSHIIEDTDASGKKFYVCMVCKKRFRARSQVSYHAYCNGQRKPYECLQCEEKKTFASHSHYKYHMRVHRNERTYPCDVCGQAFFQMSKLRRHKLKHSGARSHACGQCDKAFTSESSLRQHRLVHTGERPHACAHCARRFRDPANMAKHVKMKHNAEKRPCGVCGGSCAGRCAAGAGRRHQCARCPRAFHSSKDLRRHIAVHTDSKPFRCKVCAKNFRRKDNLERHIRTTHPEHAPSAAVECDETALKQIANGHYECQKKTEPNGLYDTNKKTQLEITNGVYDLNQKIQQKTVNLESNGLYDSNQKVQLETLTNVVFNSNQKIQETGNGVYDSKKIQLGKSKLYDNHLETFTNGLYDSNQKMHLAINGLDINQKIQLKTLNPLPPLPLPQDLFSKDSKIDPKINSSYIMSANNARQSVIVGRFEKPPESPECEYVHKIRKANCHNISLPPMDANKFAELDRKTHMDTLRVAEPPKDGKILKKILCDDVEGRDSESVVEHSPQVHWRKLKLNCNW